jgi:nicotinamidase-related amidase
VRIQHVVQSGFSTGGFVLSIVREASDKDYQIAELTDGCTKDDREVQLQQLP